MKPDFETFFNLYQKVRSWPTEYMQSSCEIDYQFAHTGEFYNSSIPEIFHLSGFIFADQNTNEKKCLFGFWETIDDIDLNRTEFKKLEDWAKSKGAVEIIGPVNGSTYRQYRFQLDNFDERPYLGSPSTPFYYDKILEKLGMSLAKTYTSYLVKSQRPLNDWLLQNRLNLSIKTMTHQYRFISPLQTDWDQLLPKLYRGADEIFGDNFIYSPITYQEFSLRYGRQFQKLLCPASSRLVLDKNDNPIGAGLCFPDPLAPKNTPRLLIRTLGIETQHRQFGATYLRLIHEMAKESLNLYQEFMFCLMREGNLPDLMGKELADTRFHYSIVKNGLLPM